MNHYTKPFRGLVDGDIIATVAAAIVEPTWWHISYKDKELESFRYKTEADAYVTSTFTEEQQEQIEYTPKKRLEPVENALQVCKTMLLGIKQDAGLRKLDVYVTSQDKSNFRFDIAKTKPYKGHRTGEKPTHFQACYDYLVEHWNAIVVYGMEADDALAMEQARCWAEIYREESTLTDMDITAICSTDKDLLQVPGYHWNFNKKALTYINQVEGDRFLAKQWLMGDSTDNIPGCPRIGDKTADKIIKGVERWDVLAELVKDTYVNAGMSEEMCIEQFNLVFLLRDKEDYETVVSKTKG